MNKANSYQQIINKAQEYVRSGKTIINVFFGIGVIEALFVGYILNRMEIGSLTNTLIVAIILGTTYILYILFATIISMLEQLSVNNELLIHLINETQNNGLIEENQYSLLNNLSNNEKKESSKSTEIVSKSLEGEDIFIGKIIEKQSDAAFNFEDLEGKQYLLKMNNSEDCIIGKNVRVFGINRGLKEYRSVIGTVEMETIDVRHIEIL